MTRLRNVGLTVTEIRELAAFYFDTPGQPIGPRLGERLVAVKGRIEEQMAQLSALRDRISEFEATHQAELAGRAPLGFHGKDPRRPSP